MAYLAVNPVLYVMSFSPRNSNSNSPPLHLQSNVQNTITITPNNQTTFSSGEKIIEITPGSYRNDTNKKYNPEIANVIIGTKVTVTEITFLFLIIQLFPVILIKDLLLTSILDL